MDTDHLLYVRKPDGTFGARFECHVDLLVSYDTPDIVDSSVFVRELDMEQRTPERTFRFELRVPSAVALARIRITDLNRGSSEVRYVAYNELLRQGRDAFLVSRTDGEPVFGNRIRYSDSLLITFREEEVDSVWCKCYFRNFALAAPPFSFDLRAPFNHTPDSTFRLPVNGTAIAPFGREGFYHLQADTSNREGCTLYSVEDGFPKVVTTRQMADALRYLCSRQEFAAIDTAANLRAAVDRFWLERSSWDEDRARILVRKYYNRVGNANRWFSSFTEGWRTDRGMIYVIFGPPNTVYRYSDSETWIYGTENSPASLNLLFVRVENPYTPNDFVLSRSPIYEAHWYRAVDLWRQGRAYNLPY
jgi:GWxTD domain-containing protein